MKTRKPASADNLNDLNQVVYEMEKSKIEDKMVTFLEGRGFKVIRPNQPSPSPVLTDIKAFGKGLFRLANEAALDTTSKVTESLKKIKEKGLL